MHQVILLYLIIGFFLGSLYNSGSQPPNVLGGYPPDICHDQYPALKDTCLDMQQNGYVESMAGVMTSQCPNQADPCPS